MSDLAACTWPLAIAWSVHRLATAWERIATSSPAVNAVYDEAADPATRAASVRMASAAVPEDLVALALTHSETWAQEDTLKAMREKYESTGNWNAVRSAFGVGRIDEAAA